MNDNLLELTVKDAFGKVGRAADASLDIDVYDGRVYVGLVKDECQIAECYFYLNNLFKEAMLEYLQVEGEYRMKGIGGSLAKAVEDVCIQNGIEGIELVPKNEDARSFWLKQGYTDIEELGMMVKYL